MLAETRRQQLLDLIVRRGFATLDELVRALGVSESTIRRDLEALDLAGTIKRTHGGAICSEEIRTMPTLEERSHTQAAEKRAIGLATAALIEDGDTVLLDGGTTTLEVARALAGRAIQVVTNSLPIAQLLASYKETDLILIGGYVYPRTGVAMGPIAISTMQGIRVRLTILGANGIVDGGIYNSNSVLVETQRQMMECGQEVLIVADSSKFGRFSLSRLCGLAEIQALVSDPALPEDSTVALVAAGVKVHRAPLDVEPRNGHARGPGPRIEMA